MLKRVLGGARGYLEDALMYASCRLSGEPYSSYYGKRMDRIVRRNPQWGLNLNKRFQLDYLVKQGLSSNSCLLDYGCGAAAAGIHFIGYLDAEQYVGVDVSGAAIHEAQRRIANLGLDRKRPRFLLLTDMDLQPVATIKFDFIWAQSVLTHMPPEDVRALFRSMATFMTEDGIFFANFARGEGEPRQRRLKDWYFAPSFLKREAEAAGMAATIMGDWNHPNDESGRDTMLRMTRVEDDGK